MDKMDREKLLKMGASKEFEEAAKAGDMNRALASLDAETAAKVRAVLADKGAAEKLLKSPQAQQLMKMFLKDKNNG